MFIETITKYKDKDNGKVFEEGDLRDVGSERAQQLINAGVAKIYIPKKDDAKTGGKGKKGDKPKNDNVGSANGEWSDCTAEDDAKTGE